MPHETVGPAASYAQRAIQPSRTAPVESTASPTPMIAAPESARTTTLDECKKGLGTTNKFYFTSRFAACSGASFVQTWLSTAGPPARACSTSGSWERSPRTTARSTHHGPDRAIYQPSITITPPPNAQLTGDLKGDLFFLPPR